MQQQQQPSTLPRQSISRLSPGRQPLPSPCKEAEQGPHSAPSSEAQLLAELGTIMAGLPAWLCSSMRDSLYRLSLLSDTHSSRGAIGTLKGADLLVAQILYSQGSASTKGSSGSSPACEVPCLCASASRTLGTPQQLSGVCVMKGCSPCC